MDRPKWMPDKTVILEIQDGEYIDGEVDDAFSCTGLRAQIAAFRWALEDAGDKMTNDCADWFSSRIEALEEELER